MPTIQVKSWVALTKDKRPSVKYNGKVVTSAYRDPSYPDIERYVIVLEAYGVGSKKPDTELVLI